MDFAELVMSANTRGLKKGEDALDDLVDAGDRAERQTKSQTEAMGSSYNAFARRAGKALGGLVAGISAYQIAASGMAAARSFDAALAETSTLIDGTAAQMDYLDDKAVSLAKTFGTDATQQVQAFYQALSAGAASVEDAGSVLETANALAKGGITSVSTAVGILSGVVNTYGADVISAEQVSDALFVGMRAGVTTIDELSNSIGMVLPMANAMGISFDEAVAATAALTKNNLSTSVAVTSLNAALTAISGPTSQAQELAEELGLEFNSTALQAQGFGAFMQEVSDKTGGSVDAMRTLFGSVEGMKAALLFAGEAGGQFADIMEDMEDKTGQTAIAVDKISDSLSDRLDTSLAQLSVLVLEFGQALLTVAVPALEAVVTVATLVGDNLDVLGVAMAFLAATQIPAMVAGLVTMVGTMTTAATVAGTLTGALTVLRTAAAFLGGPIGILAGLAGAAGAAFLLMRDDADESETSLYDVEAASQALDIALNTFTTSGAPSAGRAAINLANDNVTLAESAYDAAEAELALARASLEAARAQSGRNTTGRGVGTSRSDAIAEGYAAEEAALNQLDAAERALEAARADRKRAVTAVTGADYSGVITPTDTGTGSGAGTGGGRSRDRSGDTRQQEEANELRERGIEITNSLKSETMLLNEQLDEAQRLFEAGALSEEAFLEHTQNLKAELAEVEFGPLVDGLSQISSGMIDAMANGESFADAFEDMARRMIIQMLKIIAINAIGMAFGIPPGTLTGGNTMSIGSFGGGKMNGGGVDPSKPHLVGEAGPELFQPLTFGTIIPNSQVGPATQRMAQQQQAAPKVNVASAPVEVVVLDDPRRIDEYRMTPEGERARGRADRRVR